MEKLFVLVFLACMVAQSYQGIMMEEDADDIAKRLLDYLKEKQEEKRTESVGDIMKRVMTDFDVEKRHSCDAVCGADTKYPVNVDGNCLCYNKRSDYERRGCVEECSANGLGNYGHDINGKGCECFSSKRELVEKRAHSCSGQCRNEGYMVNIDGENCQCFQRRESMDKRGCNENCKDANFVWGLDNGDGKGCTCMTQRDLLSSRAMDCGGCTGSSSYCADFDGQGPKCVGSRELERLVRCSRCSKSETCLEAGKKGLRCIKKRDLEDLVSRVLADGY